MAPSFCIEIHPGGRRELLDIARRSIQLGLRGDTTVAIEVEQLEPPLGEPLGVFVTLSRQGALRGCIGSMASSTPLARGVADAAYSAAFQDHRFRPLREEELDELVIEISVLSPLEPIAPDSRQQLLGMLRPGEDGLLLEDGRHRSTFLPKVWEQLPDPDAFLDHLLAKAGLTADHWSDSLCFRRYRTFSFCSD